MDTIDELQTALKSELNSFSANWDLRTFINMSPLTLAPPTPTPNGGSMVLRGLVDGITSSHNSRSLSLLI
jgi:hypothetical protein